MNSDWNRIKIEKGLKYVCEWATDKAIRVICNDTDLGWFAVNTETGQLAIGPTHSLDKFRRELNQVGTVRGDYTSITTAVDLRNGFKVGHYTIGMIGTEYIVTHRDSKKILARGTQLNCWLYLEKKGAVG